MSLSPLQDLLLRDVPVVDGYKVLEPAVLVEKLPEGGMAAVYRGLHLDLKVEVAVKVLKKADGQAYTPQAVARFRQEAEQAARLNDPNLVRIYDFPANRLGLLYLVMEYVDGETLESRVQRKGRLQPREAVTIALLTARGLAAAHAERVVHRDIKPPNILVSKRGHVKVTDLGIAKAQDSAAVGMTQEVTLLGTPQYMAPELWRGARFASAASDVFALGATLAFMLTGRHLLDGQDVQEIMHRALTEGFPDLARVAPDVPQPLCDLVRQCCAGRPQDRPGIESVMTTLAGLQGAFGGECPLADAAAGAATQPLTPTRFPSRSDLELIRRRLEQKVVRRDVPATLGISDDPSTRSAELATMELEQRAARSTRPPGAGSPQPMPPGYPPTAQPLAIQSSAAQLPAYPPTAAPQGVGVGMPAAYGPTVAASVPPIAVRRPRRKSRVLRVFFVGGLFLVLVGAAGVFGYQEGWIRREWIPESVVSQQWLAGLFGAKPTSQPATQPATTQPDIAPLFTPHPTTGPATSPTTDPKTTVAGGQSAATQVATTRPDPLPPTTGPVLLAGNDPTTRAATQPPDAPTTRIAATNPASPATGPAVAQTPTTRRTDPPPATPMDRFNAAVVAAAEASRSRRWSDVLTFVADGASLAESVNRRPDYVAAADSALMAFRADLGDLDQRRDAFPQLLQRLLPAVKAGSGPAALVVAEQYLDVRRDATPGAQQSSDHTELGIARAARYLDQASRSAHPAASAEARVLLREAVRRQIDYLGSRRDWPALIDWLAGLPVAESTRSTDPADRAAATAWVAAADAQLSALVADVADPSARRRLVPADAAARLGPVADAGSSAMSLLLAESAITPAGEGVERRATPVAGAKVEAIEEWLNRGIASSDGRVKSASFAHLFDLRAGQVRGASEARQWQQALDLLITWRGLLAGPLATPAQGQTWSDRAHKTVLALRADVPDLDQRRRALGQIVTPARQLADAGVRAAGLLLAEATIGYEGNPPRATARGGDVDLRLALAEVQRVLRAADCPTHVREAAQDLEFDIFAGYAWHAADTVPPAAPAMIGEKLGTLADCAATPRREADFAAVVDRLLRPGDAAAVEARVRLAEHRMKVVEDELFGHRSISQKPEIVAGPIRQMLLPARDAADARIRGRANGLLGEIAQQKSDRLQAWVLFSKGVEIDKPGDLPDAVSLMGLAWFHQLTPTDLAGDEYKDPVFRPLREMSPGARALKAQTLYREAARSGDPYALFLAAQFTYKMYRTLDRALPPQERRTIEEQLQQASRTGHSRAAKFLKQVQGNDR